MEQFIIDQIKYGLKYLPKNLVKSYFIPQSSSETKKLREKGYIRGICHPRGDINQIIDANIEWLRFDIPFPYENGKVTQSFIDFKEKCRSFAEKGIKVMAVTPYPESYLKYGINLNSKDGEKQIKDIALFILDELKEVIGALQITNEMGIPRFTIPLTMDEAARFIGIQLEALYPVRENILIGYNSAGPQADLHLKLKPYHKFCDYVGVDIYMGCFFFGTMWMFDALLRYLWAFTGKPILLQEFGYISGGASKSKAEKNNILKQYGSNTVRDAKENITAFVDSLPKHFSDHVKFLAGDDSKRYFNLLFKSDLKDHLYCELPSLTKIPGYDHTPEGQAKFYKKILPHLYNLEFMAGSIIYCYSDSDTCYVCGQSDCPVETRWGIVDRDCNPKPSYYAVKEEFGKIKKGEK